MSDPLDKGVCGKHNKKKKGVSDHCGVFRCCDSLHVFRLKKITLVTKIKADISLNHKVCQKTINNKFQRVKRRR